MSAMKPDAWQVVCNRYGENDVLYHTGSEEMADGWVKYSATRRKEPLYTLATVRKWLEEISETVIAAGTIYDMKDDLSDIGADAEGIFRAMLAAKLREMEGGE